MPSMSLDNSPPFQTNRPPFPIRLEFCWSIVWVGVGRRGVDVTCTWLALQKHGIHLNHNFVSVHSATSSIIRGSWALAMPV